MKRRDFLKLSAALALTGAAADAGAALSAGAAGAELFALEPVTPYTDADLDYNDSGSRTSQERADPALQEVPLVSAAVDGWDTYEPSLWATPSGGAARPGR